MRRRHDHIDAVLRPAAGVTVVLEYHRNDHLMFALPCADEASAREDSERRLRALERAGWVSHW